MKLHGWKAVAAIAAVGLTLASCSSSSAPEPTGSSETTESEFITTGRYGGEQLAKGDPTEGGSLRWAVWIPINSLDPAGVMGDSIQVAMKALFDTLTVTTPDGGVEPNLAKSLTTEDNLVWTLELDPEVKFTDGTPLNADAVITHITNVAAEGSTSVQAADARRISGMEATGDYTVEFTLHQPYNQFDLLFAQNSMGMIPSPTAKEAAGADFATNPVGAGPFMLENFNPGVDVTLKKNPDYKFASEGRPYLDEVTLTTVSEESSRISGIVAGDFDGATVASVPSVEEARAAGLTGLEQPVYTSFYLFMNNSQEDLSDVRLRTAINEALDRDAINQVVYEGLHQPLTGVLAPSHPFADDDIEWPSYDEEDATKLVDEYKSETGKDKLDFTITIVPGGDNAEVAPLVQQMLQKVGIDASIETQDQTALVGKFAASDYDIALITRTFHAETTTVLSDFFRSDSTRNWGAVNLPELDDLLKKAGSATSSEERTSYIPDMLKVMGENVVVAPIVTTGAGRILGPRVAGFPDGDPTSTTIESIDLTRVWVTEE